MLAGIVSALALLSPPAPQRHSSAQAPSMIRLSRRQMMPLVGLAASSLVMPRAAGADGSETRVWTSGRSDPIRKTSKDKVDGTKKDPKYLSCLNDCIPRCLGPPGSEAKERFDCMAECQDECCFTYQQCTYTVR